jgi:hypothetical protein
MRLTASAVSYIFASQWAPRDSGAFALRVPGARVNGPDTAGNLLNVAIWSLREQGQVEVEQLRPLETERAGAPLGGDSFARLRALGGGPEQPGLEGALLGVLRESPERGDVRAVVLGLDLDHNGPWNTVGNHCFGEAEAAELLAAEGSALRRPVIADKAAVEALRERDAEIVAARGAYRESNAELDGAVVADCIHAVHWALNS